MSKIASLISLIIYGGLSLNIRQWWSRKVDSWCASFVRWLMSKRSAQIEVAQLFSRATPMCDVLHDAVIERMHDMEADNIRGIDAVINTNIEDYMRSFEVDVEDVRELDRAVASLLEEPLGELEDQILKFEAHVESRLPREGSPLSADQLSAVATEIEQLLVARMLKVPVDKLAVTAPTA